MNGFMPARTRTPYSYGNSTSYTTVAANLRGTPRRYSAFRAARRKRKLKISSGILPQYIFKNTLHTQLKWQGNTTGYTGWILNTGSPPVSGSGAGLKFIYTPESVLITSTNQTDTLLINNAASYNVVFDQVRIKYTKITIYCGSNNATVSASKHSLGVITIANDYEAGAPVPTVPATLLDYSNNKSAGLAGMNGGDGSIISKGCIPRIAVDTSSNTNSLIAPIGQWLNTINGTDTQHFGQLLFFDSPTQTLGAFELYFTFHIEVVLEYKALR
jgi:hypothetical protein